MEKRSFSREICRQSIEVQQYSNVLHDTAVMEIIVFDVEQYKISNKNDKKINIYQIHI